MKFKVSIPATSANIGPGFDLWGVALNLRNEFICQIGEQVTEDSIEVICDPLVTQTSPNHDQSSLEDPRTNLLFTSYHKLMEIAQREAPAIHIRAKIAIPLARGLGSSSTAILGGVIIANEILRKVYQSARSLDELFAEAVKMEGHPDNIAPALYGGFILSIYDEKEERYLPISLPWRAPVIMAGVIPHIALSTEEARQVIEPSHELATTAFQSSRTALLVHLLSKTKWAGQDRRLVEFALQDKIHQPARTALVPGMKEAFADWKNQGSLGCFLSGAGTTLLGLWDKETDPRLLHLSAPFSREKIAVTEIFPKIDHTGLIIEHISGGMNSPGNM